MPVLLRAARLVRVQTHVHVRTDELPIQVQAARRARLSDRQVNLLTRGERGIAFDAILVEAVVGRDGKTEVAAADPRRQEHVAAVAVAEVEYSGLGVETIELPPCRDGKIAQVGGVASISAIVSSGESSRRQSRRIVSMRDFI